MMRRKHRHSGRFAGALYLGVEGGGTRTTAWVCDERGRVRGRATAGAANPVKVGLVAAKREILAAADRALAAAGGRDLDGLCLGLAGADRAEISGPLLRWLRKRLPAGFHFVTTDAAIALEAARGRLPCIVLIAGTGSIACARDADGNVVRAGGWGSAFGDAGSGFDLGRQAVGAALRAVDGYGAPTRLLKTLPRALGVRDVREIVGLQLAPADIAALAPVVIGSARAGDTVAHEILDGAGGELANLALALISRLGLEDQPVSVACAGGLLLSSAEMRRIVARHVKAQVPQARCSRLRRQPVEGALALALSKGDSSSKSDARRGRAPITA
ncbi:MAG TPA: BadF/BadG/BcrA/BcrD ATPase family protein [Terriglobia bacterium]|nr:BadF/BadG/BcrA/BcrD ATPase family protein [Terriglobia bacterium]